MNRLRTALRERTQPTHSRLDEAFSELDLKRREDYGRFLEAQAAAITVIEARLDAADAAAVIPDWSDRKRSSAIQSDLKLLGRPLPYGDGEVDWITDRASIIGTVYVLEGSRLGGKMLLKVAQASPDDVVTRATAFLAHGEDRRFWPTFDLLLADTELSDAETDRMVDSADRTFQLFALSAGTVMKREFSPA